jgi:hypothetical protein
LFDVQSVDPKKLQLNLRGFLNRQAATFMSELWNLLLDAQRQPHGVPSLLVQDVKEQLKKRRVRFDLFSQTHSAYSLRTLHFAHSLLILAFPFLSLSLVSNVDVFSILLIQFVFRRKKHAFRKEFRLVNNEAKAYHQRYPNPLYVRSPPIH